MKLHNSVFFQLGMAGDNGRSNGRDKANTVYISTTHLLLLVKYLNAHYIKTYGGSLVHWKCIMEIKSL